MSQNRGTFQYGITFDTSSAKKSLQELEALMSKMDKMSVSDFMKVSGETNFHKAAGELQDLQTELKKVRTAYKDAFDPKLGVVNMQTFLQKTGSNIQDLSQKFSKIGAAGSKAFASMHANSVKISSAFRETNTLLDKMGKSLMNTIKWNISSSLVNTFTGKVQEAYGYVKHLDSSLNDIRIVTGKSADEMSRFAKEANQAAQQVGKTTTDYTEASLIYYQQGLSDSDVKNMTDLTLKASNVTGEATTQVSEYFTALKNGYQIATEDMESQVDKMAAVAASTASDLGELSTAVSRVASTAAASGVGLDSLIAQISTIESVTRQAPESIGTALKTVYARLGDLKVDGSVIDEDGFTVKLGEVSGQLQQMGVNILDVNGNMRDQQEVIEEIGAKWQNWTKEQKEAAAIAMAGKRQYNNLFALFENFDQYNKAMETSAGALGTLQKQQKIYEESTEYHLNKLTTQWEDFYDSMLDTHTINTVTDLFTGLLKGITTITDALGGGVNVLTTFVGLMGQLQSKNIVNTFIKPIIDQKFAQQFNEGNIAQVKANIQTWEKEGKISNIAVQGQQRFAQKMDEHIGNFTKEDANAYNASIDRIGQAGAKVFEVEESIKSTKNEIDTLEKSFSKVFQESLPKGVQLTKQEAEQLNKEIKNLIDNNDIKEAEDYKKALEDIFDQQMQAKVDALKQRLDELNKVEEELNNAATNNEKKRIRSSSAKELNIPHKKGGLYDTERQQEKERVTVQLNALMRENAGNYNSNKGDFGDESLVKITDLIDKTQNLAQANEILLNAKKGVVQVTKEELAQAEQIVAQKRAQHYVEIAGAVTTLASSLNSLINIGNTVKGMLDGSIPSLQGVLTIVTTLGMTIPMLITSLTKLVTTEVGANAVVAIGNKLHLKAIAGLSAETLAQNGLTAALAEGSVAASSFWASLLGPIALVVGGIALIVAAVDHFTTSNKEAQEALEETHKVIEESNNKLEELNNKYKEQTDRIKELNQLKASGEITKEQEEELSLLEKQNLALEHQIYLQEKKNKEDAEEQLNDKDNKQAVEDVISDIGEFDEQGNIKTDTFGKEIRQNFGSVWQANRKGAWDTGEQLTDVEQLTKALDEQYERREKLQAQFNKLSSNNDPAAQLAAQQISEQIGYLDTAIEHNDELLTKHQTQLQEGLNTLEDQYNLAVIAGDEAEQNKLQKIIEDFKRQINAVTIEGQNKINEIKGNKKSVTEGFSWNTVTDEKSGATNLTNYVDAAKQAYEELSSWSSKSSSEFADFSNTQFAKLLDDMNLGRAELEQLYGKDNNLVDQILGVKDGSIQNAETIEGILKDISQIGKVDIALSDNSITAEEIQKLGIGFEDLDAYMIQNANDSEKLTKATEMWNNVMQVSLKNIGATNEELVGMERYLQGTSKDLGKLEIGNHTLQKLAYEALKAQKGLEGIKDIVDELSGMTIDQIEADPEALAKIEQIKNGLADAFNIDPDSIDNTWVEKNLDNIKAAIEKGGEEARQLLKDLSTSKETMISLGINTQLAQSQWQQLVDLIPDNIEVGAVIDDEQFIKGLANMISSGRIAASQIQNALSTIGVEIDPEKGKEIELELGKIETLQKTGANGMSSEAMQAMKSNVVAKLTSLEYRAKPLGTGTKSSPKTGGGGGGSSKGSQPKQTDLSIDKLNTKEKLEPLEEEVDRYHEIDTAIQMTENSLERYGKVRDKVFGTDIIKNNEEEVKNLNKEIDQLTTKFDIAARHQDEMAEKLIDKGFTFNEDGTIANYEENLKKTQKDINNKVAKYKKDVDKYNKQIKEFNTEAYKEEEKSQKLKFTDKEEKRYSDLTAKVNKAKKEAQKKDTYDKLKDEEKKYLGLKESEKKELKSLYNKLGKQKKLQDDFDRWKYLKEKKSEANLSKKEQRELEKFETKYKNLAGAAARLAKEEKKLDDRAKAIEDMKNDYSETADLAAEYDSHVSEFMEEIVGQIDEKILAISEKKLDSLHLTFTVSLDLDNAQKQWTEWQNTISMASFSDNVITKSNLKAIDTVYGNRKNEAEEWFKENDINSTINNIRTATSARDAWLTSTDNARSLGGRLSEIGEEKSKLQKKIKKAEDDKDKKKVSDLKKELANLNKEEEQLFEENEKLDKEVETKLKEYQESFNSTDYGVDLQAYRDDLKENIDAWMSWGAELATNLNEQYQLLGECLNQTREKFEKLVASIDNIIDANKTVISMTEKMYGTDSKQTQTLKTRLYGDNVEKSQNKITVLVEESNTLETQRAKLQARIDKETNQNRKDILQKELDTVKNAITENDKALINATNASLDEIATNTEYANQLALQQAKKQVWNEKDGDFEKRKFDWQMSDEKSYYDPVNKAYQIQSLIAKKQKEITKIDNVGKQQRITKLLKEQTSYLQEQAELTEYQVKRAEKILDIELARIALEEAQNNKSTLRLRRDSQGNYSYQYTSDEDDVANKQQKLMDSYVQLYNMDKEQMNKIQQEIINNRDKWAEEIQKAQIEYYQKYGEKMPQEQVDAMIARAQKEEDSLMNQLNEARANIESKFVLGSYGSGKLAESALKDFEFYTSEMLSWNDSISDIINGSAPTLTKTLTELSATTNDNLEKGTANMEKSFTMAGAKIDETTGKVNTETIPAFQDLGKELKTTGEEADILSEKIKQINTDFNTTFTTITEHMDEYKQGLDKFETEALPIIIKAREEYEKLGKEILKAKQAQDNLNGGGGGGTTDNGGDTNTGNNGDTNNNPPPTPTPTITPPPSDGNKILKKITEFSKIKKGETVYISPKANVFGEKNGKFTTIKDDFGGTLENNERKIDGLKNVKGKGQFIKVKEGWIRYLDEKEIAYGSDIKNLYAYKTGGYTGDWGSDEGRIGILHRKELVLNEQDTENILAAVQYMRDSILLNAMQSRMSGMSSSGAAAPTQNIQITANFPNASNHSEIETAFNNLLNRANQYMGRKF